MMGDGCPLIFRFIEQKDGIMLRSVDIIYLATMGKRAGERKAVDRAMGNFREKMSSIYGSELYQP